MGIHQGYGIRGLGRILYLQSPLLLSGGCVFSPIFPAVRVETQFSDFLDGLGPAQLVGRQTLATPAIGELHHAFNPFLLILKLVDI